MEEGAYLAIHVPFGGGEYGEVPPTFSPVAGSPKSIPCSSKPSLEPGWVALVSSAAPLGAQHVPDPRLALGRLRYEHIQPPNENRTHLGGNTDRGSCRRGLQLGAAGNLLLCIAVLNMQVWHWEVGGLERLLFVIGV